MRFKLILCKYTVPANIRFLSDVILHFLWKVYWNTYGFKFRIQSMITPGPSLSDFNVSSNPGVSTKMSLSPYTSWFFRRIADTFLVDEARLLPTRCPVWSSSVSMIFHKISQPWATHVGIHLAYMTLSGPCLSYEPGKIGRCSLNHFLKIIKSRRTRSQSRRCWACWGSLFLWRKPLAVRCRMEGSFKLNKGRRIPFLVEYNYITVATTCMQGHHHVDLDYPGLT